MSAPEFSQSNVASLPPPDAEIATLMEPVPEPSLLTNFERLTPLTPAPAAMRPAQPLSPAPWHLPSTVGPFLANALRSRWESYRAQLRSCQDEFSERTVHELRVATRRLMAQLVMLGCVTPGETAEKARRVLKRRLKALGELRDTHVQRLFIERQLSRFPQLILVQDSLKRRERRLEKATAAKVNAFKTRKLETSILALGELLARKPARPSRPERLATIVARATAEAFAEVVRRRDAIDPANPGTIHRTRIAFKKFRYMVEALSSDGTGLNKRDLRALAHYQRRMGNLQDLEVMQQCITGFLRKHLGMEALLRPFIGYLKGRRARALRGFLRSANELYEFWPPGRAGTSAPFPFAYDAAC
ncbi:MAG TPA: CHAD domain-containing protein [Candidatus Acidoferrum sp.]|jgi:CHAD domain-containing protein|nr:CHAD domain-containing protein [Candidatus Acidoferrum sp.]